MKTLNITISGNKRSFSKRVIRSVVGEYHNKKHIPFICYSEIRDVMETIMETAKGQNYRLHKLNVKGDTFSVNISTDNETIKVILHICYDKADVWKINDKQFKNRFEWQDNYFNCIK